MLKEIKVRNLFGYYNYNLNFHEGICFFTWTNAGGKTQIAKIANGYPNWLADQIIINYDAPVDGKYEVVLKKSESTLEHADLVSSEDVFTWFYNNEPMLYPMSKEQFNLFKKLVEGFYNEYSLSYKKLFFENGKVVIKAKNSAEGDWIIPLDYEKLSLGEQQLMIVLNRLLTTTKETIFLDGIDCFMHVVWQQYLYEAFEQCLNANAMLKQIIVITHSPFTPGGSDNYVDLDLVDEE